MISQESLLVTFVQLVDRLRPDFPKSGWHALVSGWKSHLVLKAIPATLLPQFLLNDLPVTSPYLANAAEVTPAPTLNDVTQARVEAPGGSLAG
jgi:hypothetical protein